MLKDRKQRDDRRKRLLDDLNKKVNDTIVMQQGIRDMAGPAVYTVDFSNISLGMLEVSVYATYAHLSNRDAVCLVNKELYGRLTYWGRVEKLLGEKYSFVRECRITHSRTVWLKDLMFCINVPVDAPMYQGLSLNRMFNDYVVDKKTVG